jgi:hypothetical protein
MYKKQYETAQAELDEMRVLQADLELELEQYQSAALSGGAAVRVSCPVPLLPLLSLV